jgi:hypothetical protein
MATTQPASSATPPDESTADPRWQVAGGFLDALTRRDFERLAGYLDGEVQFRVLTPPAQLELCGPAAAIATFQQWFGRHQEFALLDAEIGQVGQRLSMRWRFWVGNDGVAQTVEQHVFITVAERIVILDLLCSGFQVESTRLLACR